MRTCTAAVVVLMGVLCVACGGGGVPDNARTVGVGGTVAKTPYRFRPMEMFDMANSRSGSMMNGKICEVAGEADFFVTNGGDGMVRIFFADQEWVHGLVHRENVPVFVQAFPGREHRQCVVQGECIGLSRQGDVVVLGDCRLVALP